MTDGAALAFELRDVRGPRAFAGGWRRFLELLWLNAKLDFKLRYAGSILSYGWALLRPLALFGIIYAVFSQVFRFGEEIPYYAALLVFNIVVFHYFSEAVGTAVASVVRSERVVRKTQFPRAVIPLAIVVTGAITMVINLVAISAFILASDITPRWSWLLLPLALVALMTLTACLALLCSALYTKYRDVGQLWTVVSRTLFYGTPILWPVELVPEHLRAIMVANPLAPLFIEMRRLVFDPDAMGSVEAAGSEWPLLVAGSLFVATCMIGVWYFVRRAPRIAEDL